MKTLVITSPSHKGIKATLTDIGASLLELHVPDSSGQGYVDVITGPVGEEDILADRCFMGATVGRVGNRVAEGRFSIDGEEYQLTVNDGEHHLHGGFGVHKKQWKVKEYTEHSVTFEISLPDGEDGYPGNCLMTARYWISNDEMLNVEYKAVVDKACPVNMVQHAYWNLSGDFSRCIDDHVVTSDDIGQVLEVEKGMIPTGNLLPVAGTVFDFREGKPLCEGLGANDAVIATAGGYDHCLIFSDQLADGFAHCLEVSHPGSGRSMKVETNMPAVQIYSGNFLDGTQTGKGGAIGHRTGMCVETQHYVDALNQVAFPSMIIRPGEVYMHKIRYTFGY